MACLRGSSSEGHFRTVQCDEEGCQFRLLSIDSRTGADAKTSETDCVLQLRLRAGDAQESSGYDKYMRKSTDRMFRKERARAEQIIDNQDPFNGKHMPSTWKGPRPNAVYLDEYQQWVGNWEDEYEPDDVQRGLDIAKFGDFDVDRNKYVMPAIESDTSKWYKHSNPGSWRSVGVHDLGEGLSATDELPGPEGVDESDQGEVRVRQMVSEESRGPRGWDGYSWRTEEVHGNKDFKYGVVRHPETWAKSETHLIRGEN